MMNLSRRSLSLWAACLLLSSLAHADAQPHRRLSFGEAAKIPLQAGGRVKPLDSFAREAVLFITGSRSFEGWEPLDLVMSWIAQPKDWEDKAFIRIGRDDLRRQLGLDDTRTRFTPKELFSNSSLAQYANGLPQTQLPDPKGAAQKQNPRETELKNVLERLSLFRGIVAGEAWAVVPAKGDTWETLATAGSEGQGIRGAFVDLFKTYIQGDSGAEKFSQVSADARIAVEGRIQNWDDSSRRKIQAEYVYNRTRPYFIAWVFYLIAGLAWVVQRTSVSGGKRLGRLAFVAISVAAASHVFGLALRCYVAGRPPVTNMYESVVWVSLGAVFFAWILYLVQKQTLPLAVASILAVLGLVSADIAPTVLDPGIHPLVPVLRSNYWLTIHVLTITLGYAAFALSYGLANVTLTQYFRRALSRRSLDPEFSVRIAGMNLLTYRAMQFGVVLLAAGTILGGIWADYSWGRFWGWDPKEVWALICLLCYIVILHGRYAGWIGQFSFSAWTVVAFSSVVMAWYGVNFVLGVGLHSYGFSNGGFGVVGTAVGLQLAYVVIVAIVCTRSITRTQAK